jgi:hypothetical protein
LGELGARSGDVSLCDFEARIVAEPEVDGGGKRKLRPGRKGSACQADGERGDDATE